MSTILSEEKEYEMQIPEGVLTTAETLVKSGFQAFLVGGCVRDLITGKKPKDWDITTDATPEQIIALFPKTFYENKFGTVGVVPLSEKGEESDDPSLKVVEVTPFRREAKYSDNRRPDEVIFSKTIDEDLKRRDFTINTLALSVSRKTGNICVCKLIDQFGGQKDLKNKILRAVGNPDERFKEDALRLMRAVRLATEHNLTIEPDTRRAIIENAPLIEKISWERIRDEFSKILLSPEPMKGLILSHELGILGHIVPELLEALGVEQNQAHAFHVWEHLLRSVQHAADKGWGLDVRLTALFHDIAKPATRRTGKNGEFTFYGHEVVGAKMTKKILERLKYPQDLTKKVVTMVRWHMFFADTEQITLSAVRRMIVNVGKENIWDLLDVRTCDRIGTGRPKENPYRLRKYRSMIEEALRDPISVGMLKIDGNTLIQKLNLAPGPKIGFILHALLEEVLENPKLNTHEYLEGRAQELINLSESALKKLGESGKEKKELAEEQDIEEIRKKHWVK